MMKSSLGERASLGTNEFYDFDVGVFQDDEVRRLPANTVALHIEIITQFSEDSLSCKVDILLERGWDLELGIVWLRGRAGYEASVRVWPRVCEEGLSPELECPVS